MKQNRDDSIELVKYAGDIVKAIVAQLVDSIAQLHKLGIIHAGEHRGPWCDSLVMSVRPYIC